jgi:hypothetical protein
LKNGLIGGDSTIDILYAEEESLSISLMNKRKHLEKVIYCMKDKFVHLK